MDISYDIKNNRKIFKDNTYFDWFIINGQYQLLKNKLESNELVYYDKEYYNGSASDWLNQLYDQDKELAIGILKLILKSTSINYKDQVFQDLHNLNEELIQIATDLSSPYSIQVLPTTLENSFKESSVAQIKLLLDSFYNTFTAYLNTSASSSSSFSYAYSSSTFSSTSSQQQQENNQYYKAIVNEYKISIIKKAYNIIKDPFQRDRVLQLILSNSKYYSALRPTNSTNRLKIDIIGLLTRVISIENQNKLLDLNYYYIPNYLNQFKDDIKNIISGSSGGGSSSSSGISSSDDNSRIKLLIEYIRTILNDNDGSGGSSSSSGGDNFIYNNYSDNEDNDEYINNDEIGYTEFKFINFSPKLLFKKDNLVLFLLNNRNDWKGINGEIQQLTRNINKYINEIYRLVDSEFINNYIGAIEDQQGIDSIEIFINLVIKNSLWLQFRNDKTKVNFVKLIHCIPTTYFNSTLIWSKLIERTSTSTTTSGTSILITTTNNNLLIKSKLVIKDNEALNFILKNKNEITINENDKFNYDDFLISSHPIINNPVFNKVINYNNNQNNNQNNSSSSSSSNNIQQQEQNNKINIILQYPLQQAIELNHTDSIETIISISNQIPYVLYNSNNNHHNNEPINKIIESINKLSSVDCCQGVYYLLDLIPSSALTNETILTNLKFNIIFCNTKFHKEDKLTGVTKSLQLTIIRLWIKVFVISLKRASRDRIALLLKLNFNPIIQNLKFFIQFWKSLDYNSETLLQDIKDSFPVFQYYGGSSSSSSDNNGNSIQFKTQDYSNRNPDDIIGIIKLLINHWKQQSLVLDTNYYESKKSLNLVINYLFRLLIQNNGEIIIEKIETIYNFINESQLVRIQRSTLFSLYYLAIKSSNQFIKYISNLPVIKQLFIRHSIKSYYISDPTIQYNNQEIEKQIINSSKLFKIEEFINSDVFTFEFIISSSFEEILNALIMIFIDPLFQQQQQQDNSNSSGGSCSNREASKIMNHLLKYLLKIKRDDLVFNYLELFSSLPIFEKNFKFSNKFIRIASNYYSDNDQFIERLLVEYPNQLKNAIESGDMLFLKYYIETNSNNHSSLPFKKPPLTFDEVVFIFNNHPKLISKTHQLLFDNSTTISIDTNILELHKYPINLYRVLFMNYPYHPIVKLSKISILNLLDSGHIYTLKQLYQNQFINDSDCDYDEQYDDLLSFLKQTLINHKYYKYLNWFNSN